MYYFEDEVEGRSSDESWNGGGCVSIAKAHKEPFYYNWKIAYSRRIPASI